MPSYELALIVKALHRPEIGVVLKRTCEMIMEKGGIIRSLENIGSRTLPYIMSKHGSRFNTGSYFIVNFDSSAAVTGDMNEMMQRDIDIIRPTLMVKDDGFVPPCKTSNQQCEFGELPNPDHERRLWRGRILRNLKLRKYDKKEES